MQTIAPASATGLLFCRHGTCSLLLFPSYWQPRLRRLHSFSIATGRGAIGAHFVPALGGSACSCKGCHRGIVGYPDPCCYCV